jgi:hypothetical protein
MASNDLQRTRFIALSVVMAASAISLTTRDVRAELGGAAATVDAPASSANGVRRLSAIDTFQVRSTIDAGGTTINEYATRNGRIFGYTWQGPTMPDLTQLLGPFSLRYRDEATRQFNTLGNLHASRVEQPDVVVESGGQMRSYIGRAWLPAALPQGFSLSDLH